MKNEWVNVLDRLPDKYANYLIFCPNKIPTRRLRLVGYVKKRFMDNGEIVDGVSHWLSIPKLNR